ncbi:hypothetical protein JG687_00005430 [Phytophthora cactorum]|uniref:Uncharacterized protein n=1 Tax=Phytophthora cactorum TaxID=29920 RepID=A0A8T1UKX2_9STRA|nr:hypothetical protein GQ600_6798 [Phytophthora cactorum]KAG6965469.1 hypothetical protein JG687_00005430 [Phytophthora cactorum]
MCAAVALPTILIETQARIVLLGTQSTNLLALGAFGMALFEIGLRVGKAHYLLRTLHQKSTLTLSQQKSHHESNSNCGVAAFKPTTLPKSTRTHTPNISQSAAPLLSSFSLAIILTIYSCESSTAVNKLPNGRRSSKCWAFK